MKATTLKLGGIALLTVAVAVLAVGLTASATADPTDSGISITDPENQTIEVMLSFSGSTSADVSLVGSETSVKSPTVSGSSGSTESVGVPFNKLPNGTYQIQLNADDESAVSVNGTTLYTQRDTMLNLSKGENATVDVGFNSSEQSSAVVTLSEHSNTLGTETLEWYTLSDGDNTGVKTAEIEAAQNVEAANVTVATSQASAQSQIWVEPTDDSVGIGAGLIDESDDIPPWASAIGGIAVMLFVAVIIVRLN
ncbi:hypothetical protein [Halovenus salina]|uniref:PGF-CTERM sorting domain-containing protein n=1 Tax=Halovenus salina TaxID=1510225 RepID=A0ABD5VZ17_9EURY|nr:hypothetical protein [Halovenus salina]